MPLQPGSEGRWLSPGKAAKNHLLRVSRLLTVLTSLVKPKKGESETIY